MSVIILSLTVICYLIFKRYFPIIGLKHKSEKALELGTFHIVDLRDYNESYQRPVQGAINIPVAYLNRYYTEIPKEDLHVVASNHLEKNIGIRFLRQKGFNVVGYTLTQHNQKIMKETYC